MAHYMVYKIEKELDTRDKRFMFLKLSFPSELPLIDIEGSSRMAALNIIDRFIKNDSITDFENIWFKHFS